MNLKITRIIAAAILILGAFKMPYGYYKFVRISTFIIAGILLFLSYQKKNELWMVLFGILLVLFNPIYPMAFDKTIWAVIDILSAVLIIVSIKYLNLTEGNNKEQSNKES